MGYMRHHSILVSGWQEDAVNEAREKAVELFNASRGPILQGSDLVSAIHPSPVNGYFSFAVFPDGSKEGWDTSEDFDARRADFLRWVQDARRQDKWLKFVEVEWADDEGRNRVTRSEEDLYEDEAAAGVL